jgi:hypothetical protein
VGDAVGRDRIDLAHPVALMEPFADPILEFHDFIMEFDRVAGRAVIL